MRVRDKESGRFLFVLGHRVSCSFPRERRPSLSSDRRRPASSQPPRTRKASARPWRAQGFRAAYDTSIRAKVWECCVPNGIFPGGARFRATVATGRTGVRPYHARASVPRGVSPVIHCQDAHATLSPIAAFSMKKTGLAASPAKQAQGSVFSLSLPPRKTQGPPTSYICGKLNLFSSS